MMPIGPLIVSLSLLLIILFLFIAVLIQDRKGDFAFYKFVLCAWILANILFFYDSFSKKIGSASDLNSLVAYGFTYLILSGIVVWGTSITVFILKKLGFNIMISVIGGVCIGILTVLVLMMISFPLVLLIYGFFDAL